jgi:DNA-binding transcriptional LysR family regulator
VDWGDRIGRRLKPRDLHIFMSVVEHGNMAKAAERLSISRPVVSKTITDLEHTLGVPLFDRTPQGVEPTAYGRALCARSTAVFDELRQSIKEIEFLADPTSGELRIGCTETLTAGLVSTAIEQLSRDHPKLVFQMELADVATLHFRFLRERKCELIVSRALPGPGEPDMNAEPLFNEKFVVVVGPESKWLRRRRVGLAELADAPWILSSFEVVPGAPLFEAFTGLKFPRAIIFSNSLSLRTKLLADGRFVTLVPGSVLQFGSKHLQFKPLPVELPRSPLPVVITTLKNRTLSPMAQLFIERIRELVKPLARGR